LRAFLVAAEIERVEDVGRELGGLLENRGGDVRCGFLEARKLRDLVEAGELAQHELHFGEGGVVLAHLRLGGLSITIGERRFSPVPR
jgi:hypothetical protein